MVITADGRGSHLEVIKMIAMRPPSNREELPANRELLYDLDGQTLMKCEATSKYINTRQQT